MLRSSSKLLGSELQALLNPYKSAACWRESPLLRSFEVKNSELPSPELQALLSPHNSTACGQQSPLLRGSEVKNSEWRAQIAPASAVCGELGLPSLERETARLGTGQTNDRMTGMTGLRLARKKNK